MTAWLLTWFWQGCVLATGLAAALACAPRLNAATRHLLWCGSFAAVAWLGWAHAPKVAATATEGIEPLLYVPTAPDLFITMFVGMWAAAALIGMLRVLSGLRGVYALRDRCQPFPTSIEAQLPLWLDAKTRGRRTLLVICDAAPGATVLGFERPCIAIPSAFIAALTLDELDQVILHEHAHVQRRDDWSRLLQLLLLSVLWIHPAAVLMSRAIDREREMACDEWVVARTTLPKVYAKCLARAAELRVEMRGASTLLPALLGRRHELVRRVDRLLTMRANVRRSVSLSAAAVAACAMTFASVQLQDVRFAEIGEIVFPAVQSVQWVRWVQPAPTIGQVRQAREVQHASVQQMHPASVVPEPEPIAPFAPAPDGLGLSGRIFTGVYSAPVAPVAPVAPIAPAAPNHWVAIGTTAKKTSIGLASAFTRAGASLARRF
jgi:beta-lactamase regulating signal transducer with metallopeptidase domain